MTPSRALKDQKWVQSIKHVQIGVVLQLIFVSGLEGWNLQ
jgi:hypothetical protein